MASENFEDASRKILSGREKVDALSRIGMAESMANLALNKLARSLMDLEPGQNTKFYKSKIDNVFVNFRLFAKQGPHYDRATYNSGLETGIETLIDQMVLYDVGKKRTAAGYAGKKVKESIAEIKNYVEAAIA